MTKKVAVDDGSDGVVVTACELSYVDPAAGNDKFYRVFDFGLTMAVQYGKTGTYGTFKRSMFATRDEARAAADKQATAKFKKGYEPAKNATLTFTTEPTDGELDAALSAVAAVADAAAPRVEADASAILERWNSAPSDIDPAVLERVLAHLADAGFAASSVDAARSGSVPVRPMLAATLDAARITALLADELWVAQPKLDGDRFVVEVCDGVVAAYNRAGQLKTSNVAPALLEPFRQLTAGRWVFDGEVVGRTLHLFDIAAAPGVGFDTPFTDRHRALAAILDVLAIEPDVVAFVDCAAGSVAKRALLDQVVVESREGLIFRHGTGSYEPGRRSTTLLKHKLVKTADCVVVAVASKGKANATLAVHDDAGALVEVGAVSTIGKGDVRTGDVVEVQFLYVVDPTHPRMFQPRMLRVRADKAAQECSIDQFAAAGTNKQW